MCNQRRRQHQDRRPSRPRASATREAVEEISEATLGTPRNTVKCVIPIAGSVPPPPPAVEDHQGSCWCHYDFVRNRLAVLLNVPPHQKDAAPKGVSGQDTLLETRSEMVVIRKGGGLRPPEAGHRFVTFAPQHPSAQQPFTGGRRPKTVQISCIRSPMRCPTSLGIARRKQDLAGKPGAQQQVCHVASALDGQEGGCGATAVLGLV